MAGALKGINSESSVREGTHVNAIGAYTPEMAELSPDLLERAYVVVDDLAAAAAVTQVGQQDDFHGARLRALSRW